MACGSGNEEKETVLDPEPRLYENTYTMVPEDTLEVPIGKYSDVYSKYIKRVEINGHGYLGVVNENKNELEFYPLETKRFPIIVPFDKDGPNRIGKLKGFEVISDTSLLIGSSLRSQLYISNLEGEITKSVSTRFERDELPYVQIYYTNEPLVYSKDYKKIFVYTRVDTDYNSPGMWSGTMFLSLPLDKNDSPKHVLDLPSHFGDYVYGSRFCHNSHAMVGNRYLVFGPTFSNDVFIYDLETGNVKGKEAGSKYFGDVLPWTDPINDSDKEEEFFVESNSYGGLAYDEQNEMLFRIAYKGVDYIGADGTRRTFDNKIPSVVIMNSDFEKMGEIDLEKNTYYTKNYFTYKGKLYLSTNHPDNNPSEDKMVYVGFKIVRI